MTWKIRTGVVGMSLTRSGITYTPDVNHKRAAFSFVRLAHGKKGRQAVIMQAERITATDGNAVAHGCPSMSAAAKLLGVRVHLARW